MLDEEGLVAGWDHPWIPALVELRRRRYTPEAMRLFKLVVRLRDTRGKVKE